VIETPLLDQSVAEMMLRFFYWEQPADEKKDNQSFLGYLKVF